VQHVDPVSADALARVPLFARLDRIELDMLAQHIRRQTFEEGSVVVREGTRGPRVLAFFIIEEGTASVSVADDVRARLQPGDYFGEIGLLRESPRTATVRAESELTCLGLSAADFRAFLESKPEIAIRLLDELARRLEE
jgi:CRP/FNR family transcriptional regulator, cyclic AMP receptor protein